MPRSTSPLTVRFRGVRGSTPSPSRETVRYGGNTSCVELRYRDQIFILDAGTGIRGLGEDLAREFGERSLVADVLISHTHWDHIQGFPFFAPAYASQNQIRVLTGSGEREKIDSALRNQMSPAHFPVGLEKMQGFTGVEELASDDTNVGSFSIRTTSLNHPGGCSGFRIAVAGSTIAYLPDHEPYAAATDRGRQALVEFIGDVDLLILDTQYTDAEYAHRIGWGHGSLSNSVAMATEAQVKKLLLFHHDPSHQDEAIDAMLQSAQAIAGDARLLIEAASEGTTFTLASERSEAVSPPVELAKSAA